MIGPTQKKAFAKIQNQEAVPGIRSTGHRFCRHAGQRKKWRGISTGDAFRFDLDWSERREAQRRLYTQIKSAQQCIINHLGEDGELRTKAQISPCYSAYPPSLAAMACVGLTAFLEYKAWTPGPGLLSGALKNYLQNPAAVEQVGVDPKAYSALVRQVVEAIETRLILENLSKIRGSELVEIYRMYAASQRDMRLGTVRDIMRHTILYGDLLPPIEGKQFHPLAVSIARAVNAASKRYLENLKVYPPDTYLILGVDWARAVSLVLTRFVPNSVAAEDNKLEKLDSFGPLDECRSPALSRKLSFDRFRDISWVDESGTSDSFEKGPIIFERFGASVHEKPGVSDGAEAVNDDAQLKLETQSIVNHNDEVVAQLSYALSLASNPQRSVKSSAADLLKMLRQDADFIAGAHAGPETNCVKITIVLDDGRETSGELLERSVELSDDFSAQKELIETARPISRVLSRTLYSDSSNKLEVERLQSKGALDGNRLPIADVSAAVFKRRRPAANRAKNSNAVLLITCDGSGSLSPSEMRLLKVLTAAWLESTRRTDITVLAGLYHTDCDGGSFGKQPLVQWISHPFKTLARNQRDAVRAVVALPSDGIGGQADALSLAFMIDEARAVARGQNIYHIWITDCCWVRSFDTELTAEQEVVSVLNTARTDLRDGLHTTLVKLGKHDEGQVREYVDAVIALESCKMDEIADITSTIGASVAASMRDQRRQARCYKARKCIQA